MNISLSTKPTDQAELSAACEPDMLEMMVAQESLHESFYALEDSCRQLDSIQAVMSNIDSAVMLINKYGMSEELVSALNADGGLEALCGSVETLEKDVAIEALVGAKKTAFERFKEGVKLVFKKIWEFICKIYDRVKDMAVGATAYIRKLTGIGEPAWKRNIKKFVKKARKSLEGLEAYYQLTTIYDRRTVMDLAEGYSKAMEFLEHTVRDVMRSFVTGSVEIKRDEDVIASINDALKLCKCVQVVQHGANVSIEYDSDKLKDYDPQTTTFEALGWRSKGNVIEFMQLFGKVQKKLGDLKAAFKNGLDAMDKSVKEGVIEEGDDANAQREFIRKFGPVYTALEFQHFKLLQTTHQALLPLLDDSVPEEA